MPSTLPALRPFFLIRSSGSTAAALKELLTQVEGIAVRHNPLSATLRAALASLARGNLTSTLNQLHAFKQQVRAQVSRCDAVLAAQLMQAAIQIENVLKNPQTDLHTYAVSPFQVNLVWADGLNDEDGFRIERSTDGVHFSQIAQVLPNTSSFRNTGLFPQSSYWYRVRPFKGLSNGNYSNIKPVTTPATPCATAIAIWGPNENYAPSSDDLHDVVAIDAGPNYNLALWSDGTIASWGDVYQGSPASPPTNLTDVVAIAAGEHHALALRSDGTVIAWGENFESQASPPADLTNAVAIAAGIFHSLALLNDGTVVAWGGNGDGQASPPTDLRGVVAIAAGAYYSLALKSDGTVVGWGSDFWEQATPPSDLTDVVGIAAGSSHSLALKIDGTVVGWGSDSDGQATAPPGVVDVAAIEAGYLDSLAVLSDGTLRQWGLVLNPLPPELESALSISLPPSNPDYAMAMTTLPARPRVRQLQIASAGQINVAWQDLAAGTDGFRIERAVVNPSGDPGAWELAGTTGAGETTFSDLGVVANTSYLYRVQAHNACGYSLFSPAAFINFGPPEAPWLSGEVGISNQVNVFWGDTLGNASAFVLETALDNAGNPGAWEELATIPATNFISKEYTYADYNVAGFTTRWYRARAFNAFGTSPESDEVAVAITPPDTSIYPYLGVTRDRVTVQWYGNFYGNITGFQIERALDNSGSPGEWSVVGTLANVALTNYHELVDSNLTLNTYWYRVRALNWVGASEFAVAASVTIALPPAPDLVARIGNTNQVELTLFNLTDQDGVRFERADDVAGVPGSWSEIGVVESTDPFDAMFVDPNVVANATYWYRARSFNVLGHSAYSWETTIEVTGPPAPAVPNIQPFANTAQLSWFIDYSGHLDGWEIQRAPDAAGQPGAWATVGTSTDGQLTHYVDSGLSLGTYWYRIRGFNWLGSSPFSEPASVTIALPAPPALYGSMARSNAVRLYVSDASLPYDQDGFSIERAPDVDGSPGAWSPATPVLEYANSGYASFKDTNVFANTTNWYRARAYNALGVSAYSDSVQVHLVPPQEPDDLEVLPYQSGYAFLSWVTASGLVETYQLDRATNFNGAPGLWQPFFEGDTTYAYDYTVPPATGFWYRVRALNWAGASGYVVTGPAHPTPTVQSVATNTPLQITDLHLSNEGVVIRWQTTGGTTNIVEAANTLDQPFTRISAPIIISGTGITQTNFTDPASLQNNPSRFYRIRSE